MKTTISTEKFIHTIRKLALPRVKGEERHKLQHCRLMYGASDQPVRGVTWYARWKNGEPKPLELVSINPLAQESIAQLAGTTLHELAHVLAGPGVGHGPEWKAAAKLLGLHTPEAAGQQYTMDSFDEAMRAKIEAAKKPNDGTPIPLEFSNIAAIAGVMIPTRPCSQGVGTRGGKSRGKGSGSRLRKFVCECTPPVIVRAARDELRATCHDCNHHFHPAQGAA